MRSEVFFTPAHTGENNESLSGKARELLLRTGLLKRIEKGDFVALKIHFGEKENTGYIRPAWLAGVIGEIKNRTTKAFLTDTSTLYIGNRSNAIDHLALAWEHGFQPETVGLPLIIADGLIGRDSHEIRVDLPRVKTAKIASAIANSDALLGLNHLTGHVSTGVGAALKNLGMGCASRAGKLEQHSDVHPRVNPKICRNCGICLDYCPAGAIFQEEGSAHIQDERCIGCGECLVVCKVGAVKMRWDSDTRRLQEKMAEYASSVCRLFKGKVAFLNFVMKVTKDCDCMAKDQRRIVEDIGILSSVDPVAIDKASVDLVLDRSGKDVFRAGYDIDWSAQLNHAEKIGLGTRDYTLIELR